MSMAIWAGKRSLAMVIVFAFLVLAVMGSTSTARSADGITVLAVDDTPLVSPGGSSFGPQNTIGMALIAADGGAGHLLVTEVTSAFFSAMSAAALSAFDLIAVNNHPGRIAAGLGGTWQGVVGVAGGGRVVLTSHDAPRFHMLAPPGSFGFGAGSPGPGVEPFGAPKFILQSALWAGGVPGETGMLMFNDAPGGFVPGIGWDNPVITLPPAWGISDAPQIPGGIGDGGYTDILPAFAAHPVYAGLSDVRFGVDSISSFSANIGDGTFHSVFASFNSAIFTPTEVIHNAGVIDVGGFGVGAFTAPIGPDGLAITLVRDAHPVVTCDALVSFDVLPATISFDAGAGTFSFDARLTNTGTDDLTDLASNIVTLTNGNTVLGFPESPAIEGDTVTLPTIGGYADGVLASGETADIPWVIDLTVVAQFDIFVDVECRTRPPGGP